MSLPATVARRRQKETDGSLIDAAYQVVTAQNRVRWEARWTDGVNADIAQRELQSALASLREVVLRQDQER